MTTVSDVAIVGAGIVGLATAMEMLNRHPSLTLRVIDKEPQIAAHQSGHNSGVIHSGIYYAPGSLKARLCVEGSRALMRFCAERGIPIDRCGKVIVATHPSELGRLQDLYNRGVANGVQGLELIGPQRLRELEPYATGIRAIYSPVTAIVDYTRVAAAYADEIRARGGEILTGRPVTGIVQRGERVILQTPQGEIETRYLITCGGLYSDRLAEMTGAAADPRIVPFRGDYYVLVPSKRYLVRGLIYPVPDPALPFLGVHFTKRIDGEVWAGPNAVLAFAREGYEKLRFDIKEDWLTLSFGGFWRLARKYWRTGLDEMVRDFSKAAFVRALQRYLPSLRSDDVVPGPSGVRAQALSASGALVDDFIVSQNGNAIHVRNAPSPGATSSLAIGRLIVERAEQAFALPASAASG